MYSSGMAEETTSAPSTPSIPGEHLSTQSAASRECAADLGALLVNRAEFGRPIQRDARAISFLIHTTHSGMLDDELLRNFVRRIQFDQ
jgi:hypothetical protein